MADVVPSSDSDRGTFRIMRFTLTDDDSNTIAFGVARAEHVAFYQAADQTGGGTAFASLVPVLVASDGTVLSGWVAAVQTAGMKQNAACAATVAASTPGFVYCSAIGGLAMKIAGVSATDPKSMVIEVVITYKT